MRISITFMQKDRKGSWFSKERFAFEGALARPSSFNTKIIFFESRFWRLLLFIRRTTSHHLEWQTPEGLSLRLGSVETFFTLIPWHHASAAGDIKYSSIKLINEVNIVLPYSFIDGISGGFWAYNEVKPTTLSIIIPMLLRTLTFWLAQRVSERYNLTSILPTVQFEVIHNSHIEEELRLRNGRKYFRAPA